MSQKPIDSIGNIAHWARMYYAYPIEYIESLRVLRGRGYRLVCRHINSVEHLRRYVSGFASQHGVWTTDTESQTVYLAHGMDGKSLCNEELAQ